VLGKPKPVLEIDAPAPRSRVGRRRRIEGKLAGSGVDLADATDREFEDIDVILRIGVDAVDADRPAVGRVVESTEVLVLPGLQVETHDLRAVRIFYPDLAVDFHARHREMRLLGGVRLPFLRYRINPQRARGAIEPRHAGLVHQADPEIAVVVDFE